MFGGQPKVLKIYGAQGPLIPMRECADLFERSQGVEVKITVGPVDVWVAQARQDADIIFGGAEYMICQFAHAHPGFVDTDTRTSLYVRAGGILVRKGNPKQIRSMEDLAKRGMRVLEVCGAGQIGLWEDMARADTVILGIQKNMLVSVKTSSEAIEAWRTIPELEAWTTFESWHYRLKEITDLVRLPGKSRIYRATPIVVTTVSQNRQLAKQFIQFLTTQEAHRIFRKWGWK
jgi:accessory colonization factor AcfC